jgi:hypothetical protein
MITLALGSPPIESDTLPVIFLAAIKLTQVQSNAKDNKNLLIFDYKLTLIKKFNISNDFPLSKSRHKYNLKKDKSTLFFPEKFLNDIIFSEQRSLNSHISDILFFFRTLRSI